MGWNPGVDKAVGDLVTAANWNNYMGTAGSIEYVNTQMGTCTQTQPSRAYNTVYQNTSSKVRIVTVVGTQTDAPGSGGFGPSVYCDGSSSPTTIITRVYRYNAQAATATMFDHVTFVVPPNFYYKYAGLNNISDWTEYDLH